MEVFYLYLKLGFEHIIDFQGYDHILFILTLCGVYLLKDWKPVLILVTAFTLGHTITLALATLNIIATNMALIEFLIPVTIFLTAITNISFRKTGFSKKIHAFKYATALLFGLIHGLGFSNYLRSLLGQESSIFKPLLAFNIGLELGQILIVSAILLLAAIFVKRVKVVHREWNLVISGAGLGISAILCLERFFDLIP